MRDKKDRSNKPPPNDIAIVLYSNSIQIAKHFVHQECWNEQHGHSRDIPAAYALNGQQSSYNDKIR